MTEPPKVAICAIAKNEALYIEEWIAFHLLQQVSSFLIFDNESTDSMRDVLARVAQHVPVEVVDWPSQGKYYESQMAAYYEGAKRLAGRVDWVAFIDLDEFIFSSQQFSLPAELAEFDPHVGAIAVGHRIFGSSGHVTYEPDLVTNRFVRCARSDHPQAQWFKTIARPTQIEKFDSAHSVVLKAGKYLLANHEPLQRSNYAWHPGHADRVGNGTISLSHYMVKSLEEYRWKQERFLNKGLKHRYDDGYFNQHDDIGNEVENEELRRFAEPIRAMISRWQ